MTRSTLADEVPMIISKRNASGSISERYGNPRSLTCKNDVAGVRMWEGCQTRSLSNAWESCGDDKGLPMCVKAISDASQEKCAILKITGTQVCEMGDGNQIFNNDYAVVPNQCVDQCQPIKFATDCLAKDESHYTERSNILSNDWVYCLEHPAYNTLASACSSHCTSSTGGTRDKCQSCIDQTLIGSNPFTDKCSLRENLPETCKYEQYPILNIGKPNERSYNWDYQMVPTSCGDDCLSVESWFPRR
jgi:hypothetical protein